MSAHTAQRVERLTPREREVFEELVVGHSSKAIVDKLSINPRTVEGHHARVMKKMEAQSLPHLVRMALAIEAKGKSLSAIHEQGARIFNTPQEREHRWRERTAYG